MEFATEGYYFFDLVRWGIAAEKAGAYLAVEKTGSAFLTNDLSRKDAMNTCLYR